MRCQESKRNFIEYYRNHKGIHSRCKLSAGHGSCHTNRICSLSEKRVLFFRQFRQPKGHLLNFRFCVLFYRYFCLEKQRSLILSNFIFRGFCPAGRRQKEEKGGDITFCRHRPLYFHQAQRPDKKSHASKKEKKKGRYGHDFRQISGLTAALNVW